MPGGQHEPLTMNESSVTPHVLEFPGRSTQESGLSHENYLKRQQGMNCSERHTGARLTVCAVPKSQLHRGDSTERRALGGPGGLSCQPRPSSPAWRSYLGSLTSSRRMKSLASSLVLLKYSSSKS